MAVAPTFKDVVEALTATLVTVLVVTEVGAVGVPPAPPHEITVVTIRQTTAPDATTMGSVWPRDKFTDSGNNLSDTRQTLLTIRAVQFGG